MPQHKDLGVLHHSSRRDNLSSDMALDTVRKISFNPTSRRSSHALAGAGPSGQRSAVIGASGQVAQVFGTRNCELQPGLQPWLVLLVASEPLDAN